MARPVTQRLLQALTYRIVIPGDRAQARETRTHELPAFVIDCKRWESWVPALASLGRDDSVKVSAIYTSIAAGSGGLPRIRSEAFSAIISTQALMWAETRSGIAEASTTRSRSTPRTSQLRIEHRVGAGAHRRRCRTDDAR